MALADQPRDSVSDVSVIHEERTTHREQEPSDSGGPQKIEVDPVSANPHAHDHRKYVRPSMRFVFTHPAHTIGVFFGVGSFPFAAGTMGTLAAWISYAVLSKFLTHWQLTWLVWAMIPIGWWACAITARDLKTADPRAAVIDEVVAFWLILWVLLPAGVGTQFAAFLLFRFFDAVKFGPVAWADRVFHGKGVWLGGFGILFDDLVAGLCALLVIAIWRVL